MPFNGNGQYSAPSSPGAFNPSITGQQATAADWNAYLQDLQTAVSLQICRDGQSTVTADIPFGGNKLTEVADGTALTDAATVGQLTSGKATYAADTGTADHYIIAPTPGPAAYEVGQRFSFIVANANTGASDLKVGTLAVGDLVWPDGSDMAAGDLPVDAGVEVMVVDVTPIFQLQTVTHRPFLTPLGTTGQGLISNGTAPVWGVPAIRSYLSGLTLSTAGGSGTFGIAAGIACDTTGVSMLALVSAYTKTTGAWAVGSGNGSLDTGTIANTTTYHVFLILRPDTGVVDILTSLSATAPTMPDDYTLKRRIGSMRTDGSAQWIAFLQDGDTFMWKLLVRDVGATDPGTAAVTRTLTVPTGVRVQAIIAAAMQITTDGPAGFGLITDLAATDSVPSGTLTNFTSLVGLNTASAVALVLAPLRIFTNTSAQVRSRLNSSDASVALFIWTYGWVDTRGRDS